MRRGGGAQVQRSEVKDDGKDGTIQEKAEMRGREEKARTRKCGGAEGRRCGEKTKTKRGEVKDEANETSTYPVSLEATAEGY